MLFRETKRRNSAVAINEVVRILTTMLQKVEKATGETKD